eukprot:scaffold24916_cov63-Phaeocystis_antarctica.AAC.4
MRSGEPGRKAGGRAKVARVNSRLRHVTEGGRLATIAAVPLSALQLGAARQHGRELHGLLVSPERVPKYQLRHGAHDLIDGAGVQPDHHVVVRLAVGKRAAAELLAKGVEGERRAAHPARARQCDPVKVRLLRWVDGRRFAPLSHLDFMLCGLELPQVEEAHIGKGFEALGSTFAVDRDLARPGWIATLNHAVILDDARDNQLEKRPPARPVIACRAGGHLRLRPYVRLAVGVQVVDVAKRAPKRRALRFGARSLPEAAEVDEEPDGHRSAAIRCGGAAHKEVEQRPEDPKVPPVRVRVRLVQPTVAHEYGVGWLLFQEGRRGEVLPLLKAAAGLCHINHVDGVDQADVGAVVQAHHILCEERVELVVGGQFAPAADGCAAASTCIAVVVSSWPAVGTAGAGAAGSGSSCSGTGSSLAGSSGVRTTGGSAISTCAAGKSRALWEATSLGHQAWFENTALRTEV